MRRIRAIGWALAWAGLAVGAQGACSGGADGDAVADAAADAREDASVVDLPDLGGVAEPRGGAWRPRYHFTPPSAWMNDPNGLVVDGGVYHLFYQANPESTYFFGPMSWGHAASTDRVRWTDLPLAIVPDPHLGLAFSGSAVAVDGDAAAVCAGASGARCLIAALTFHGGDDGTEKQGLATSVDRGRTWTLFPGNPVLPNPGVADFRDPQVFRYGDDWRLVLAAGDHARIYRSTDLVRWSPVGEIRPPVALAGVWECPALLHLPLAGGGARWVFKVDLNRGPGDASPPSRYWVGEFDGATFVPETPEPRTTDFGPDFYAAQAWSGDPEGRVVWVAWMSHWAYAMSVPTEAWRGAMTVPRQLSLVPTPAGARLVQAPIAELDGLRGERVVDRADLAVEGLLDLGDVGDGLDLRLELEPRGASDVRLHVLAGAEGSTVVGVRAADGVLYVDRTGSGATGFHPRFAARHEGPLALDGGRVSLRVLVDHCSVEVFAGPTALTSLVFPSAGSTGLRLESNDGDARVVRLTADALGAAIVEPAGE